MFNRPRAATKIFKIVLSPNPHVDKWTWIEKKDGNFSVKSAYRLIQNSKMKSLGENSTA